MNSYDLFPQFSVRPGVGQPQGQVAVTGNAASAFQTLRTLPPSANNFVEYARFNFMWFPVTTAVVRVAFGVNDAALTSAVALAPPFSSTHGIVRVLLQPTDTGFKGLDLGGSTGDGGTLYWWIG
ncbi:MAG: hypothetical protein ABW217_07195 [Polyangiaceae bacterium]